jgi:hypothetical protein
MSRKKLTEEERKKSKDLARAKYREKNRELLREKNKLYRKNNPDKVKESNDNWIKNNRHKVNATAKRYRDKKPHKIKELWDSWYENNRERVKFNKIKRVYDITKEQYENMLQQQNFCCAICSSNVESQRDKTLVVDHCHTTGKIRGLLCHSCNTGIGLFKDNEQNLMKAYNYLVSAIVVDTRPTLCHNGLPAEINPAIPQGDHSEKQ